MKDSASTQSGIDAAKAVFDENVESYTAEIEQALGPLAGNHDFFMRHKAELLRDFLADRFPGRRAKVLDVGCGMGLMHRYLDTPDIDLHGVDISRKALDFAERRNPKVRYQQIEGGRFPFGADHFDLVFAINVLHHVPVAMWQEFVDEMGRVARAGAFVMVIEHNPFNPATQWVVRSCDLDRDANLLRPRTLRRILRNAGLRLLSTRNILFTPFKSAFFRRLEDFLRKVPLGAQYVIVGTKPAGGKAAG